MVGSLTGSHGKSGFLSLDQSTLPEQRKTVDASECADQCLSALLEAYGQRPEPVSVNFRKLAHWISYGERATHNIHSYPAKLLPHIPGLFLASTILSQPGDRVFDPFCGSGTVLLEAQLNGRKSAGADSNPLARLISRVKTTPLPHEELESALHDLRGLIPDSPKSPLPDVVNLEQWFSPHVQLELQRIREGISRVGEGKLQDFLRVCFSSCVKRVSLADPRLSVPVRLRLERYEESHWLYARTQRRLKELETIDVMGAFYATVKQNIDRVKNLGSLTGDQFESAHPILSDCRDLRISGYVGQRCAIDSTKESVQLILTSPPYAGAQKYIRASSLSLGWLDLCGVTELRCLESNTIGCEHFSRSAYREFVSSGIKEADAILLRVHEENPLRAHIAGAYLRDMAVAMSEMFRILQPGGFLVLVAGANTVCRREFRTHDYLHKMALELGLQTRLVLVDDIRSRALMTRRNRTASLIHCEWIILLQKKTDKNGRT